MKVNKFFSYFCMSLFHNFFKNTNSQFKLQRVTYDNVSCICDTRSKPSSENVVVSLLVNCPVHAVTATFKI